MEGGGNHLGAPTFPSPLRHLSPAVIWVPDSSAVLRKLEGMAAALCPSLTGFTAGGFRVVLGSSKCWFQKALWRVWGCSSPPRAGKLLASLAGSCWEGVAPVPELAGGSFQTALYSDNTMQSLGGTDLQYGAVTEVSAVSLRDPSQLGSGD